MLEGIIGKVLSILGSGLSRVTGIIMYIYINYYLSPIVATVVTVATRNTPICGYITCTCAKLNVFKLLKYRLFPIMLHKPTI